MGTVMRRAPATLLPLALLLPLAACAAAQDYPSLARRPAERASGTAQPVAPEAPPAPPSPPSPELTARLSQLVEQARAAHQRFVAKRPATERAVASGGGGAPGSEGWAVATVALSSLEAARSDAQVALADLDRLYTAETIAASETGDHAKATAIAAARDQVKALVTEQDEVLDGLRGRMSGG
jgi:hypothetical protein